MGKFVRFTKRTDDPKLAYLEHLLTQAGIQHQRAGHSFHAPIVEILDTDLEAAWAILKPIDDVPDDDPQYGGYTPHDWWGEDPCDEYTEGYNEARKL
jgi:hypothetical protein